MTALSTRVIAMIVGAILLVVGLALLVHSCDVSKSRGAQSRLDRAQTQATINSGADAVNTVGTVSSNEAQANDLTRSNDRDIRNAEGSNAVVNPAARDAGLRALCLRRAYRDTPKCKLLKPAP